jgi:hypothetical protein
MALGTVQMIPSPDMLEIFRVSLSPIIHRGITVMLDWYALLLSSSLIELAFFASG